MKMLDARIQLRSSAKIAPSVKKITTCHLPARDLTLLEQLHGRNDEVMLT